jgi:DUF1680 family protein
MSRDPGVWEYEMGASNRSVVVDLVQSPHARQRPLDLAAVRLDDPVWAPRQSTNRSVTLPTQLELLEQTGRLDNFRKAAGALGGPYEGLYFNDSDVYKWLEAAAWALATDPDSSLDAEVDRVIEIVAAAQQADGYLDTYYIVGDPARRWTELERTHELYCAGHLIQAAVAHHRATGKSSLLTVARRFADLICDVLGPAESGKQPGTDGHPEIEMALVELARETGERRYLAQAQYLLDARGHGLAGGSSYSQDHAPFRELNSAIGHAVRFLYLAAGAADIYAETGEAALLETLKRLWENMVTRRMYVTGGLGARYEGESFGEDFELPNARAYTETCAAIGSVMWNWRMLLLTGEAKYADLMEWTLYNAFLPGLSVDGQAYFYVNPLADEGSHRRQPWFACACCPPNIARAIASIGGYVYTTAGTDIFLHLYAQGAAEISLADGRVVRLRQETRFPWDGEIAISVESDAEFGINLRIPGWCEQGARVEVNGAPAGEAMRPGEYVRLHRHWRGGEVVRLSLPMPVRLLESHPRVTENWGRVAIARGPLVYCVEQADHPGVDLNGLHLRRDLEFSPDRPPGDLGDGVSLVADAAVRVEDPIWQSTLHRTVTADGDPEYAATQMRAIPYHLWANREAGAMRVWLPHLD